MSSESVLHLVQRQSALVHTGAAPMQNKIAGGVQNSEYHSTHNDYSQFRERGNRALVIVL